MKKLIRIITNVLFGISLCVLLILSSFAVFVYDTQYYDTQFEKLSIAEKTHIAPKDLTIIMDNMIQYFKDKRENLDMQLPVNGETREIFKEDEKSHLQDVKNLFTFANVLFYISLFYIIIFTICKLIQFRKMFFKKYFKLISVTLTCFICIVLVITLAACIDFNAMFLLFHEIFFPQGNYFFSSSTSIMVSMVPEEFFIHTVLLGGINLIFSTIILLSIYPLYCLIEKKYFQLKQH